MSHSIKQMKDEMAQDILKGFSDGGYTTRGEAETKSLNSNNNGGSTDYYKFKPDWAECADVIEDRDMNYNQGNIFKSAFCFNIGRHDGTDYERELNKIIYFAKRELQRMKT